jgi:DNA topoisomerase-1
MPKKVLVVESPTKARTIGRYLGDDFKVVSTVGHIRDLPKSKLGVDVENDFEPEYVTIKGKTKILKAIKDAAKGADEVYLAPDPDREGEAIAWHVAEILKQPVTRVEFHEITKRAVLEALKHPREIDQDRVDAQQARRILDRLVGYKISPLMWRKIKPGLSAGRVQSVAVRLICEREEEVRAFKSSEYWSFAGEFTAAGSEEFPAELVRVKGKRLVRPGEESRREEEGDGQNAKIVVSNEEDALKLADEIRAQTYTVSDINSREHNRRAQAPFTTSTLQQDGASKLGWTARRTMNIAQQLYEGVELAGGSEGLITYMRTDSVRVNAEAIEQVRKVAVEKFGSEFVPEKPNFYKSKKGAQEAHEAIRPTDARRTPDSIKAHLSTDQNKLYSLIYTRFVASQMRPAEFVTRTIELTGGDFSFRASNTQVSFLGHLRVYGEERAADKKVAPLPAINTGEGAVLKHVEPQQHFTKPPPRYTDATLVRTLEEFGIGRPSTYAPIIETIFYRGYVVRVGRHFEPTEWGFVTTEMMEHYFTDIVDVGFTSDLEERLDKIEHGQANWRDVLADFYTPFSVKLENAQEEKRYFKAKPFVTEHVCDKCGAPMVLRHGKYGRFISCSAYPECSNIKNVDEKGNVVDRPATEAGVEIERPCPQCGSKLVVKASRWGTKFVGCTSYPKCDYTSELQTSCPKCQSDLVKRRLPNRRVILICKANEDSKGEKCDFVLWGKPLLEKCPKCNFFLAEQKIRGTDHWRRYCSNAECPNHQGIGDDAGSGEKASTADATTE